MIRPALAAVMLLALPAPAAAAPDADPDFRFTPQQQAAVRRLEARLVDGDTSRQVFTEGHATRLCYRAALARTVERGAARDRDGLTERQRGLFAGCVADSGYRLRP